MDGQNAATRTVTYTSTNSTLSRNEALLTQVNQWLGLFVPSLDQSRDAQHLSYNDLPEQTQIDEIYLRQIRQRLEKGEKLRSEDTKKANELIKSFIETSTQTQQHVIARIEAKFASSDDRQKRIEEAIETEGAASWNRDIELAQEIVGSKNQLDYHEQLINVLGTELVNQREAREESDRQLTEMKGMLESLLRQVKGKGKQSDPTPERSIAAGGGDGGGNRLLGVTYTVTYSNRLDLLITLVRRRSDVCLGRLV